MTRLRTCRGSRNPAERGSVAFSPVITRWRELQSSGYPKWETRPRIRRRTIGLNLPHLAPCRTNQQQAEREAKQSKDPHDSGLNVTRPQGCLTRQQISVLRLGVVLVPDVDTRTHFRNRGQETSVPRANSSQPRPGTSGWKTPSHRAALSTNNESRARSLSG